MLAVRTVGKQLTEKLDVKRNSTSTPVMGKKKTGTFAKTTRQEMEVSDYELVETDIHVSFFFAIFCGEVNATGLLGK